MQSKVVFSAAPVFSDKSPLANFWNVLTPFSVVAQKLISEFNSVCIDIVVAVVVSNKKKRQIYLRESLIKLPASS